MSGIILPALAIGGVYLVYDHFTKKNKKDGSTSRSKSKSINNSSKSRSKSKSNFNSSSKSASMKAIKVRRNKTKKRKEEKKRPLYVYYTYGSVKGKKWSYNSLPSGWSVNKKGDVSKNGSKYTKMVTFSGTDKGRDAMKKYLANAFEYLRKKHIVKSYKITSETISKLFIIFIII